ncbi:hypothetical protein WN51_10869 [Melipona quadrifasciata]|uniref:Uncharacterized protein n=1 Tax=Melipona quadrifasciata TaxID=166423 RepID=A0A0M9A727_9HYME|nr:hypothetical protein WN51_10869 [Melipona quadrifasciata]
MEAFASNFQAFKLQRSLNMTEIGINTSPFKECIRITISNVSECLLLQEEQTWIELRGLQLPPMDANTTESSCTTTCIPPAAAVAGAGAGGGVGAGGGPYCNLSYTISNAVCFELSFKFRVSTRRYHKEVFGSSRDVEQSLRETKKPFLANVSIGSDAPRSRENRKHPPGCFGRRATIAQLTIEKRTRSRGAQPRLNAVRLSAKKESDEDYDQARSVSTKLILIMTCRESLVDVTRLQGILWRILLHCYCGLNVTLLCIADPGMLFDNPRLFLKFDVTRSGMYVRLQKSLNWFDNTLNTLLLIVEDCVVFARLQVYLRSVGPIFTVVTVPQSLTPSHGSSVDAMLKLTKERGKIRQEIINLMRLQLFEESVFFYDLTLEVWKNLAILNCLILKFSFGT